MLQYAKHYTTNTNKKLVVVVAATATRVLIVIAVKKFSASTDRHDIINLKNYRNHANIIKNKHALDTFKSSTGVSRILATSIATLP